MYHRIQLLESCAVNINLRVELEEKNHYVTLKEQNNNYFVTFFTY
jgi:hypothetical protein